MVNRTLQQVMQMIVGMTFDDKLALTAFLVEQMKLDKAASSDDQEKTDGRQKEDDEQQPSPCDKPDPFRRREYAWLKQHRSEYAGQYVALFDDQLISHGANLREVIDAARQAGYPRSLMVRIEAPDELPFVGW